VPRTVLLVSFDQDATTNLVDKALAGRTGCRVVRFDVADFPLSVTCQASGPPWAGSIGTPGGTFELGEVCGVLYRRPTQYRLPPSMSDINRRFAVGEARVGFGGILSGLRCRWLNHPARVADAEFKPTQLQVAAALGLATPRTLITNRPDAARRFAASLDRPMVYKTLHGLDVERGGWRLIVHTSLVEETDLDDESIRLTAHLFQEWVPKAYEVRATVVAGRCFAARIDTNSAASAIDFRADHDAWTYRPVDLPDDIVGRLVAYLDHFGLAFAAVDLIVTPDGEYVFLEANPNGQWGWIQDETGLPIAGAMADYLMGA
jgi:ATP-grasp ribosomal peptide maturase